MTARSTRDTADRTASERPKAWVNPKQLLDPNRHEGFVHRWIRTESMGNSDARNVSVKIREGWEPCPVSEYPEFAHLKNDSTNQIEYGGLMLCRMPEEIVAQRNAYFHKRAQDQINAVDNNIMRESDPRMPIRKELLERSTREEFGRR